MAGTEENPPEAGKVSISIESQEFDKTHFNRLPTLEASKETQTALLDGQGNGGGHEGDPIKPSTQPSQGPFFTRPEQEDPINFQAGFQFSKAPIPKALPIQRNASRKVAGFQSESRDNGTIHTGQQHGGPGYRGTGIQSHGPKLVIGPEAKDGEAVLDMTMKTGAEVLPHAKGPPDPTSLHNGEVKHRGTELTRHATPIKKHPVQPQQQQKGHIRSPAAGLGKSRLPKAFSDIQRKALIQSNTPDRDDYVKRLPKSQASSLPPSETGMLVSEKDVTGASENPNTHMRRSWEQSTTNTGLGQPLQTPKAQTSSVNEMRQNNQLDAIGITSSSPQAVRKDYGTGIRPQSQSSNVARPRAPRSRGYTSTRSRRTSPTLGETDKLRLVLSRSWNQFFIHEDQRNKCWEEKIAHMAEQLDERNKTVKYYVKKIQDKNETIRQLRSENEEQNISQQAQEDALAKLENRHQLLKTKASGFNEHIEEIKKKMEAMLTYFRPRYHQMRDQLELGKKENEDVIEQIISENNKAREEIRRDVENSRNEVHKLSETKIQDLRLEINTLQVTLEEQKNNVDRERATIDHLRQELEKSHEVNSDVLTSLKTQNQELMQKSDEKTKKIENMEQCVEEQGRRIQSLLISMKNNSEVVLSPLMLDERLKSLRKGILDAFYSAAQDYAILHRETSSQVSSDLKTDISSVRELCDNIREQEQNRKAELEWQEELRTAQIENHALLQETSRLKWEISKMQDEMKTRLEQQAALRQELTTLKARVEIADKLSDQIEDLETAKSKIEDTLKEKELRIEHLECKLKEEQEMLCGRNQLLKDQELELLNNRQEHIREVTRCHEQHRRAIEQTRTEESAKTQAEYQGIEQQLLDVERDRRQLNMELAEAKRGAEIALKENQEKSERHIHQILESTGNRIDRALEGLHASGQAQGELRTSLEAWRNDHIGLAMLQQTVQRLVKDQQEVIEDSELLKGLLDVQLRLDKTWQSHKSEVDALKRATELEKSVKAEMERTNRHGPKGKSALVASQVANRHVTIQFPGNKHSSAGNMAPVSIEDERTTRRQAASPTGIMKSAVLRVDELPEKPHQGTPPDAGKQTNGLLKRGAMNRDKGLAPVAHTAYNRPVLGASTTAGELTHSPITERTESILTNARLSPKRKRTETETDQSNATEQEQLQPTKKRQAKISHSMSNYFRTPMSKTATTKQIQPQSQPIRLQGRPIERKPSSFVTYRASSFGIEAQHSDTLTSATLHEGSRGSPEEN